MVAPVTTYAPKDVMLEVQNYRLTGIVSLTLEWSTPPFRMVRGIRGNVTRVRNMDSSAVITVEVLQTSIANDLLDSIVKEDLRTGQAKLQVVLKDISGRFGIQSQQGYVQARPAIGFSNTSNNRVWEIGLLQIENVDALGNSNTIDSLFDRASQKANDIISSVTDTADDFIDNIL